MKPKFEVWSPDDDEPNERFRTKIQRKGIGIIDVISYDDHVDVFCPFCKEAGFRVRMGPKILMPGETRPPDYEHWLQCTDCYEVIPTYVQEFDATIIRDDIPVVDNPFENTTEIIGAHAKRTSAAGKKAAAKRKRDRTKFDDDPEINELIRKYGDNVKVIK